MRKILSLAIGLAVLAVNGIAFAGYKPPGPDVYINFDDRVIMGALGAVRNSNDSTQFLQVQLDNNLMAIAAVDANGKFATCYSFDPDIISMAKAATASDLLLIAYFETDGRCARLEVFNGSYFEPKNP
jgi:hypothetical protein